MHQTFSVAKLTGIVESTSPSGVVVAFARVSASGFTRTFVGDLFVVHSSSGARRVQMLLSIAVEYHDVTFLEALRVAVFSALGIASEATWAMKVAPRCVLDYHSEPEDGYFELIS